MYETQEILDMIFVAGHQSTEVVQPREQSLDFPAMSVSAQLATILSSDSDAIALMRGDHVDTLRPKLGIQPITVVGAVADQSLGSDCDKALLKRSFDKGDFMRRSRRCLDGDRKTSAICRGCTGFCVNGFSV